MDRIDLTRAAALPSVDIYRGDRARLVFASAQPVVNAPTVEVKAYGRLFAVLTEGRGIEVEPGRLSCAIAFAVSAAWPRRAIFNYRLYSTRGIDMQQLVTIDEGHALSGPPAEPTPTAFTVEVTPPDAPAFSVAVSGGGGDGEGLPVGAPIDLALIYQTADSAPWPPSAP